MNIKGFELGNHEKLVRAAEGSSAANGEVVGGVGYENEDLLLAQYDKLGGLITKNGLKVKTGSFFDFKVNAPLDVPTPVFLVKIGEDFVEVPEGEPMPIEVEAQRILEATKKGKKAPKTTSAPKGKKAKVKNEVEE